MVHEQLTTNSLMYPKMQAEVAGNHAKKWKTAHRSGHDRLVSTRILFENII